MKIFLILLSFYTVMEGGSTQSSSATRSSSATGSSSFPFFGTHKYYLIQQNKAWADAQVYCRTTHTDLAIIKNTDDVARIQDETWRKNVASGAWIWVGLYDYMNNWYWTYRDEPVNDLAHWYPGEPNNDQGIENCVVVNPSGLFDIPCTITYAFVCFDDSKTGAARFIYNPTVVTWTAAQSYCRQYYTDLATIRNPQESSIVEGMVPGKSWVGLLRDSWRWNDKSKFSTISWKSGEPNGPGVENCGAISNLQALDFTCSSAMPFLCYSDITQRKQVIRVKVQTSQDVNDPTVKEGVLQQIRNKLVGGGMAENITVRWREQPDGEVFHNDI